MTYKFNRGSEWHKWDLHIHTPNTKLSDNYKDDDNDVWLTFCNKIEESDVDVFGITDYFSCENFFALIEKHKSLYPNSKKVFFPNIEFRLDVSVNKSAEEVNIHVIFSNEIPELKKKLEEILTKLHTSKSINDARITCSNLNPSDFISASINMNELHSTLKQVFGNNKPYIIVAASNNQGLRADTKSPRKLEITDEIDKKCDAFFGGNQNVEYYLNEDRYETAEIAIQKPVLNGCDAHSFSDLDSYLGKHFIDKSNNRIISSITWIKADLTFEGLKQVLYEPKYRVSISEQQPRDPIRKIDFIKFNFPSNTKIKRVNSSEKQDFCLKNIKMEILFSKYFTCLIGGRGTGKSTIINTLGERLNEKTDFFSSNSLLINDKEYSISSDNNNYIEISGTNEIEFVSQGKVERLAEANELTKLIFNERIKETDSSFNSLDNEHQELTILIDTNIDNLFSLVEKTDSLKEQQKDRDKVKNIIDSINDEDYKIITSNISRIKTQLTEIKNSKLRYSKLLDLIKNILSEIPQVNNENDIEARISEISNLLSSLAEIEITENDILIKVKEFPNIQEIEKTLNDNFDTENLNLATFFLKKGTSEEAIKDSQNANEKLAQIISKISELEDDKSVLLKHYSEDKYRIDNIKNLNSEYEKLIIKNIEYINRNLEVSNENILRINYKHKFDNEKYLDGLFDEFYSRFSKYQKSGVQVSKIKEVLFILKPSEDLLALNYKEFIEKFDNEINSNGINRNNLYVKVLLEIFANKYHFIIYQLLIKKHLYNIPKYIQIDGYYGERVLIDCSFGQRCTAVIVTLLMSGVKPLVIDEPEAHLDNRLIADYLVDLIKNKKLDRQIIFATHNSNFVVNGDAELIHILDIPNNDIYTNITSTSIENKKYRDKLLKLEGGEKAFLIRENKYGFTK